MSTRWYPLYQRGNPQLRVFLPNFWMKLIQPIRKLPENVVQFECSMEMTKFDIKQYLEKIYNINIVDVHTRIALGKFKKAQNRAYIIKEDDAKLAFVILPKNEKFVFPDLFPKKENTLEEDMKSLDDAKHNFRDYLQKNKDRPGLPNWYSF